MGLFEVIGILILLAICNAIDIKKCKKQFEKGKEFFKCIGLDKDKERK